MNRNSIKTEQLRLAEIREFNYERKSSLIPLKKAYAILGEINGHYINVLNPFLEYPVYERLPYSNVTPSGEEFGTMISLVDGEVKDGPCYILDYKLKKYINKENVSIDEIKEYVLDSGTFFPDRIHLIEEMSLIKRLKYKRKYEYDKKSYDEFMKYMSGIDSNKQYRK